MISAEYWKYFPERYTDNRYFFKKVYQLLRNQDFENFSEPFHQLRAYIRQPVQEWHEGTEIPQWLHDRFLVSYLKNLFILFPKILFK
jgi:hypothetical protein